MIYTSVLQNQVYDFILVFARTGTIVAFSPVFGAKSVPPMVKSFVAFSLALVFTSFLSPLNATAATTGAGIVAQLAMEATIGAAIGFAASLIFEVIIFAGYIMDYMIGFGFINIVDPQSGSSISVFAFFYSFFALLLFLAVDAHHILIEIMLRSYELIPVFGATLNEFGLRQIILMTSAIFYTGFQIAAPVFIVMFMVDFTLGMMAKTVPQLQILVVGFPIKISIGLMAIALGMRAMADYILSLFEGYRESLFWLFKYLGESNMSAADEGRTETATEKQRQKFRDEGSVAKSVELNSLFSFLAGYLVLTFLGSYLFFSMADMMRHSLEEAWKLGVEGNLEVLSYFYVPEVMWMLGPMFLALFVGVVTVNILQFGFQVTFKAIKPKWSKINPIANFRKVLLSKNSMIELIKSVAKITVLTLLAYNAITPLLDQYMYMTMFTPLQIGLKTWQFASDIWFVIILFIAILGIADYSWQRYQLEDKMKMKLQDVTDEMKQAMGDPKVKQEQRRRGMQMLQKLLSEQTREADVIITNPTHFAVALKYTHGSMGAPRVVARGVDYMAMRIRKIARKAQIPIVENRALARALYFSSEVGDEIPEQLFKPVAEILAFIFKLNKERGGHG